MSLRLKIILILVAAALASDALVIGFWQPWFLEKLVVREQKNQQNHLATLGDAILPFLLQNQVGAIYETLDAALERSPTWESLVLVGQDGKTIYPIEIKPHHDAADIKVFNHPITLRNTAVGHLELHVDLSEQKKSLEEQTRLIVGMVTAGSLLVALLIAALLEIVVGRRAMRLVQTAEDIAQGRYETPLPPPAQDEIGRLSIALDQMRQVIAAEKASLRQARDAAEASNKAKSTFLATMSHEIRTPLNGVLGMAQLLMDDEMDNEVRKDCARTILHSGQTLLVLLNDILDLSKVEAGKMELSNDAFAPERLVRETAHLFAQAALTKGLSIHAAWMGPPDACYGADATRLRQMLSNLIGNAIKFTQQGFVRVEAAIVEETEQKVLLEFSVSDSGIGISPEHQAMLFQPFSQVDDSTTRKYEGTGLGLSIIRSLAHLMGGAVGVESEPGNGSRFWFRVWVGVLEKGAESCCEPRSSEPADSPLRAMPTGKVLVVEDNIINRKVVESLLRKAGVEFLSVENGQEALDLLYGGERLSLILMDMQMPVMDGMTATRHIRDWEKQTRQEAPLPIVALTANAFEDDKQRCREAGMDDFLTKPIQLGALKAILAQWSKAD